MTRKKLPFTMPKAISKTTHTREHQVRFTEENIKNLLVFAAAEACIENFAVDLDAPGVSFRVILEKVDMGSSGFRYFATVTITEDMEPQPARNVM